MTLENNNKIAVLEKLKQCAQNRLFDTSFSYRLFEDDLYIDFSHCHLTEEIIQHLEQLAQICHVETQRDAMFCGQDVNMTEGRAALHTRLRAPCHDTFFYKEQNISKQIDDVLQQMRHFSESVRQGTLCGVTGKKITDVVNIGIGGSDLGGRLVVDALKAYHDGPKIHFVANLDSADLWDILSSLHAETTLIIIVSKSFTTYETLQNATIAKKWLSEKLPQMEIEKHLFAISCASEKAQQWGIKPDHIFKIFSWVGGRYSIWSSVGLPVMLAIGFAQFSEFLRGAYQMDCHFQQAPLKQNIAIMLGLIDFWHRVICDYRSRAVVSYAHRLRQFLPYLQQLEMESNGKNVQLDGTRLAYPSAPVIWGGVGTNCQHSFFQLLHQGTDIIPVEFIVPLKNDEQNFSGDHQQILANFLAQFSILSHGYDEQKIYQEFVQKGVSKTEIATLFPFYQHEGKRPCLAILFDQLTPYSLGRLLALCEHRVFVQACLLNINAFDQFGVELGKKIATDFYAYLEKEKNVPPSFDTATRALVQYVQSRQQKTTQKDQQQQDIPQYADCVC